MFSPSRTQVRQFFCDIWHKHQTQQVLSAQESLACRWMLEHPEYIAVWQNPAAAEQEYSPEQGQTNPFLHLSLHLAIEEQVSIDQPPGIRALYQQLQQQHASTHDAAHAVMECLAEVLWQVQRYQTAPDNFKYLDCVRRQVRA